MKVLHILLVEDEDLEDFGELIKGTPARDLTGEDWDRIEVTVATNQDEADQAVESAQYHIVLLDLRYPVHAGESYDPNLFQGMAWLPALRSKQPDAAIVIMTAYPDVPNAVQAVRDFHANDFVSKVEPWREICKHIRTALRSVPAFKRAERLREEYWTALRSQALRVHIGDIAKAIRASNTRLETLAKRFESGDRSAAETAPAQLRESARTLLSDFEKCVGWLEDIEARGATLIDLHQDLIRPLPFLYGGEVAIGDPLDPPIHVHTYSTDLKIALHEVIRNSLEAEATKVEVVVNQAEGGAVITVKDNGHGLPPGAGQSIFDAGYTTHPGDPRHSGMGLYIAKRLMADLGGAIDIRDANDGGVEATLTVPDLGSES